MIHLAQVPGHSFFFFQKPVKNIFICSFIVVVALSVPSPGDIHTPSFPSVQECADEVRSFNTIPGNLRAVGRYCLWSFSSSLLTHTLAQFAVLCGSF